jgi:hypothetical protein
MRFERHIVSWIAAFPVLAGLLLAVPPAAVAGVPTRFAIRRYRASPIDTGERSN